MHPEERDIAALWDMLEHARLAVELTDEVTYHTFASDRMRQLAVERTLEIIGEAARRVSPTFREKHPEIPWRKIVGNRNLLIHEYDEILQELLWKTARVDAPSLISALEPLLPPPPLNAG